MNARYTGHTLDGSKLFERETAQAAADAVADHFDAYEKGAKCGHKMQALAYTFDNAPDCAFPYTVWKRDCGLPAFIGKQLATFADVCREWGRA